MLAIWMNGDVLSKLNHLKGDDNKKMTLMEFLAEENRLALHREKVNQRHKSMKATKSSKSTIKSALKMRKKKRRFHITRGTTEKIDHGLPEGPYTVYYFIITFNHDVHSSNGHSNGSSQSKSMHNKSTRKSSWKISRRYRFCCVFVYVMHQSVCVCSVWMDMLSDIL